MVRPTVPVHLLARWYNRSGSQGPEVLALLNRLELEPEANLDHLEAKAVIERLTILIIKFGVTRELCWFKEAYQIAEYVVTRPRFHESATREGLYHLANLMFVAGILKIPVKAEDIIEEEVIRRIRAWLAASWATDQPATVSRASLEKAADDLEKQGA